MNETRRQAFDYFVSMGWTPAQAAGIVANLVAESNLNPAAVGDGGQAYGIAQWHPDRQAGFQALIGHPMGGSSLENQLAWVHAELQGTEKAAGDILRTCTTAAQAGACVSTRYERPADREGQAVSRASLAESILAAYAAPGAPISPQPLSTPIPSSPRAPEAPMFPLLLPVILQMIPQLAGIFGKDGSKVAQVGQLAQAVSDALVQTTGAPNLQGAIEKMQADPAAKAAAATAVLQSPPVAAMLEAGEAGGGGIAGARKAAAEAPAFWKGAPFWISLLLLLIVYAILADVLFLHASNWTPTDRSQLLMLAVAVTSGVMGYFLGSSIGSARKTELTGGQL